MGKCCLLITEQFEPTADWLIQELRSRGVPCVRWNLDRYPAYSALTFQASNGEFRAEITTDGRTLDLASVGSVWCRGFRPSGLPREVTEADREFALSESQRALDALLTVTKALWVNHPQAHLRANSKPAQLFVAQQAGLEIPPTVITNDPEKANWFASQPGEQTVYKAMSQNLKLGERKSLFTGLLTEREATRLDLIRISPGIFQRLIPKAFEVRVTMVGERLFCGRIDSQAHPETRIDWRYRPFEIDREPIEIPAEIERSLHKLMKAFDLVYGAFDFIVTPDGRYVFLEINPAGQYMWVETATSLPITQALVDVLSSAT